MRTDEIHRAIDELVELHRSRYLWFLRSDYLPPTDEARFRVLAQIQRYGDREAFVRAGELREWLSRSTSETSAAS